MQNIPIIPPGYASVAPWIIGKDTVRLMSFLSEAFDAEDLGSFKTRMGASAMPKCASAIRSF
ncbi:hypothetical protein [Neoaquamicrobium sediminum]|uniref:hypothetical protein n=1 Tax=Neoaquamicrobium sediminum TaxID=1849104 RepID=UPI0019D51F97|nr:hypothetical protein [Mesorhizobium sediminum]